MSELDGAMFRAQMPKLDKMTLPRRKQGIRLNVELAKIPGIIPQKQPVKAQSSYFYYSLRLDLSRFKIDRNQFLAALMAEGIPARGAYVAEPIYRAPYFLNKNFFPDGIWPAEVVAGKTYDYASVHLPDAELVVKSAITLPLHEGFTDADTDDYIAAFKKVAGESYV